MSISKDGAIAAVLQLQQQEDVTFTDCSTHFRISGLCYGACIAVKIVLSGPQANEETLYQHRYY
jgi:hypothetical protein